ncbi:MAG: hypothetical protein SGPRY_007970, partial [Prymnesium sp.]
MWTAEKLVHTARTMVLMKTRRQGMKKALKQTHPEDDDEVEGNGGGDDPDDDDT